MAERQKRRSVTGELSELEGLVARLQRLLAAGGGAETTDWPEAFRLVHSIKTLGTMTGGTALARVAHAVEDQLALVVANTPAAADGGRETAAQTALQLGAGYFAAVLAARAADATGAPVISAAPDAAADEVLAALAALRTPARATVAAGVAAGESGTLALEQALGDGRHAYRVTVTLDEHGPFLGARCRLIRRNLAALGTVAAAHPDSDGDAAAAQDAAAAAPARFRALLVTDHSAEQVTAAARVDLVVAVDVEQLTAPVQLEQWAGEPAPWQPSPTTDAGSATAAGSAADDAAHPLPPGTDQSPAATLWALAISLDRQHDQLQRLAGELEPAVRNTLHEQTRQLRAAAATVQRLLLRTATASAGELFAPLIEAVPALAARQHKQVRVRTEGTAARFAAELADALREPLRHLVQNAIDHGIEAPQSRGSKSRESTLVLRAAVAPGKLEVTVADDGAGVDVSAARRAARAAGVVAVDDNKDAVLRALLRPGITTAARLTGTAGRGVGLDVVATRVEGELGGQVLIDSVAGHGTSVTLRVGSPFTVVDVSVEGSTAGRQAITCPPGVGVAALAGPHAAAYLAFMPDGDLLALIDRRPPTP